MSEKALTKYGEFQNLVKKQMVIDKFEHVLGEEARGFIASLTSIVADNRSLQECDHTSILAAAIKAAVLNLPIEQSLGFAYVVPFKRKATFVIGYRGMIQLALRTNMYESINADAIYDGEEITEHRLSGNIEISGDRISDEVIGYFAYFKLKNGFEKYVYMTVEEVHDHAKKYSKSYGRASSAWTTNFQAMAKKTALRRLLNRWGLMSIKMIDEDTPVSEQDQSDPRFSTPDDGIYVPQFDDIDTTFAEDNEAAGKVIEELQRSDPLPYTRPYSPEALYKQLNRESTASLEEIDRRLFASQLNTLFGSTTARYEWCTGMFGVGKSAAIPAHCIHNTLEWLGVTKFDQPPSETAIGEANLSMEWVKEQMGQQKMNLGENHD